MLALFTLVLTAFAGVLAQECAGEVTVELPSVACVHQEGAASLSWRAADPLKLTMTSPTTGDVMVGGYGSDSTDGAREFMPASLHLERIDMSASGVVAEAHLVTFDYDTPDCMSALRWTLDGVTFPEMRPECVSVFVIEYVLAAESSEFVGDMLSRRISGDVSLQRWAPETKGMRVYTEGPTWHVFVQQMNMSKEDIDKLGSSAPVDYLMLQGRGFTPRGGKLYTEVCDPVAPVPDVPPPVSTASPSLASLPKCVPTWDRCSEGHECCDSSARCLRKNAHYAQCRDASRPAPPNWDGTVA